MASDGLSGYRPSPERFDELIDGAGGLRPAWAQFGPEIASLDRSGLARLQITGERLLENEGASHLFHRDDDEVPWRLDPLPMVIGASEWETLERGVRQRTELLDHLLADLAGPRQLLREGLIPVEAVSGSPFYQPACAGIVPPGVFLALHAVDLIRDAGGRWLVLRDHTDAPSGVGAALFHRVVAGQMFPDAQRRLSVHGVSSFVSAMRTALAALAPEDRISPRTVVLTPGEHDPAFVEHSVLAARLGYHLVVPADLVVHHGSVKLRSLTGLEAVDVLLRFTPDGLSDPLELRPAGAVGVAGLTQASRNGSIGLANALGSALGAELALAPFLDSCCRRLLGEPLLLPTVSTRWCGDPEQLADVLDDPAEFVLFERGGAPGGVFVEDAAEPEALLAGVRRSPHRYVAQRKVRMATTPIAENGRIVPGRAVLRLHVVRSATGATVLPGGQAHVVDTSRPIFTQRGDAAKDVWVLGGGERRYVGPSLPEIELPQVDFRSSLTARAAEALYWLGRNAERAETVCRLSRLLATRFATLVDPIDDGDPARSSPLSGARSASDARGRGSTWPSVALAGLRAVSGGGGDGLEPLPERVSAADVWEELSGALVDRVGGGARSVDHLAGGARTVREYISGTTWRVIAGLRTDTAAMRNALDARDQLAIVDTLDRMTLGLTAFAGLSTESVVRSWSWRFLDLGRRIERAQLLIELTEATLLTELATVDAGRVHELVLASCESLVAYRRQYRSDLRLGPLLELLLRDPTNPRAYEFQLDRIGAHLHALPGGADEALLVELAAAKQAGREQSPLPLVLAARDALLPLGEAIARTWFMPVDTPRRLRAGQG